jgi:hypothetical protein
VYPIERDRGGVHTGNLGDLKCKETAKMQLASKDPSTCLIVSDLLFGRSSSPTFFGRLLDPPPSLLLPTFPTVLRQVKRSPSVAPPILFLHLFDVLSSLNTTKSPTLLCLSERRDQQTVGTDILSYLALEYVGRKRRKNEPEHP